MTTTSVDTMISQARRTARRAVTSVRCDNRLVSRYVFNGRAVRRYRKHPSVLAPVPARVAGELAVAGVALTTVAEIVGDQAVFADLVGYTRQLRAAGVARPDAAKPYLTELLGAEPELDPANPLLRFALHPQVRGVAERYAAMRLKVQDINIWVNEPGVGAAQQSQRWHRDLPEDYDIVKCFVYLQDVPPGAGPLQYVKGSNTPAGRKREFSAEFDGIGYRLADRDITDAFGEQQVVTAAGPAGTVVFADTRGIHRGGMAVDAERVVLQITYSSDACFRPRNLRPAPGVDPAELPEVRLVR